MCHERTLTIASLFILSDHTSFDAPRLAPLVMTALFDARSFAVFDDLRRRHFPRALNRIPAHATLFHHLPGENLRAITQATAEACAALVPQGFVITRTQFLGGGVALTIDSAGLLSLRAALAKEWLADLTAQDRQSYRSHVTIQNKVPARTARETQATLEDLLPITGTIEGLALWHYRGGPWEAAGRFEFGA